MCFSEDGKTFGFHKSGGMLILVSVEELSCMELVSPTVLKFRWNKSDLPECYM
jgi:hypothetical protein